MPKLIPDRWLDYKPYGTVISGTKILPFKVPLEETKYLDVEPEKRFTTTMLLEAFPNLKFVIDLTNTDRYYPEKEFTDRGVKYMKIMTRGHEVPPLDLVKKFYKTMDDFTSACGEDDIVGVHCTHGINRTGYLVCRYLIQQLGWKLEDSIKAFEEARGYAIERDTYVTSLKRVPRDKIDTTKIRYSAPEGPPKQGMRLGFKHPGGRPAFAMPPPSFAPRRFLKDSSFSPPHFGFNGPPPEFRPMPPPGIPPIPPPPGPPPMFASKPFRYGPPPRPAIPPPHPRPGFLIPGFPPPCPSRTPGGRLPLGPPARLPPPKMPPPPPPPSTHLRPLTLKRLQTQKRKSQIRNGIVNLVRQRSQKLVREQQDFTVDTFEENLLTVAGQPNRRQGKGRFGQNK